MVQLPQIEQMDQGQGSDPKKKSKKPKKNNYQLSVTTKISEINEKKYISFIKQFFLHRD